MLQVVVVTFCNFFSIKRDLSKNEKNHHKKSLVSIGYKNVGFFSNFVLSSLACSQYKVYSPFKYFNFPFY